MKLRALQPSFIHTVKRFWNAQRILMLAIFALAAGNITLYIVSFSAQKQVRNNAINVHNKVYMTFLQAIERERKQGIEQSSEDVLTENAEELTGQRGTLSSSPYWAALWDVRKQFPQYRINLILQGAVEGESEHKSLDLLKNRPKGWRLTDEQDGWSRSFFILPTKNTAAFQVVSYIRDELNEWQITAILLGAYSAIVLFLFGWFWTRALDNPLKQQITQITAHGESMQDVPYAQNLQPSQNTASTQASSPTEFAHESSDPAILQVTAMHGLVQEMSSVLHQLQMASEKLEPSTDATASLEQCLSQIRDSATKALTLLKAQTTSHEVFEKKQASPRRSVG